MKHFKFLLLALVALVGSSAWGQVTGTVEAGDLYFYNIESGKWLGGGNSWGTQASLIEHPQLFTAALSNGKYKLDSHTYNKAAEHFFNSGGYIDNGTATEWTIAETSTPGVYTITADGTNYLGYNGTSTVLALNLAADNANALWKIYTTAIFKTEFAYDGTTKVDVTGLIKAANFSRNHYNKNFEAAWTVVADNCNLSGGNNENMCAESWRSSNGFDVSQTLTDMPDGVYQFRAQTVWNDYGGGYDEANYPYVYINNVKSNFNKFDGSETSMGGISTRFTNGDYYNDWMQVVVSGGTITVGVKGTYTNSWNLWDNFELYYYGFDLSALQTEHASLLTTANSLKGKVMNKDVSDALDEAIDNNTTPAATKAGYTAAISALNTAIADAQASIAIYAKIAALNTKAAALDAAGQAAYADIQTAYDNRTLTTYEEAETAYRAAVKAQTTDGSDMTGAIVNPSFDGNVNGWTDTFTNGNHGYQGASYTNGDVKISQFMECWIWAPGPLSDGKLSQTIAGLPEGEYTMSADIISCQQDGTINKEDLTGVYIFAKSAVLFKSDACQTADGKPETYSFDFKMTGESVEIGLMIESTNCNWVAFDNVRLTYNSPLKGNVYQDALVAALPSYTADRSGEKADATLKTAYATAYAAAVTASTNDDQSDEYYQDALSALVSANADLNASVVAYAAQKADADAINEVAEYYEAEGVKAYATAYSAFNTAYNNETLTDELDALKPAMNAAVSSYVPYGADITKLVDNAECTNGLTFNASGWSAARVAPNNWVVYDGSHDIMDFETTMHVNNWSTEGESDGSGLETLFTEIWGYTPSADISVEHETISGLSAGVYAVSVLARVRDFKNSATTPAGITFFANDVESTTEWSTGTDCAYATLTAIVELDGTEDLDFGFKYDADQVNFTWFCFKDVKLVKTGSEITLGTKGINTFSSVYDVVIPEGVDAYYASGVSEKGLHMKPILTGKIPANTGVVLKGDAGEPYTFVGTTDAEAVEGNLLVAVSTDITDLAPTTDEGKTTNYVLVSGLFCPFTGKATVNAGKAYLSVATSDNSMPVGGLEGKLILDFGDETGVAEVAGSKEQVVGNFFDLMGQKVETPVKGNIYIVNGKKYIY